MSNQPPSLCEMCGKDTTVEEALRRKRENEFPEVYWPAVKCAEDGAYGHVECFVAAGKLRHTQAVEEALSARVFTPAPPAKAIMWESAWYLAGRAELPVDGVKSLPIKIELAADPVTDEDWAAMLEVVAAPEEAP